MKLWYCNDFYIPVVVIFSWVKCYSLLTKNITPGVSFSSLAFHFLSDFFKQYHFKTTLYFTDCYCNSVEITVTWMWPLLLNMKHQQINNRENQRNQAIIRQHSHKTSLIVLLDVPTQLFCSTLLNMLLDIIGEFEIISGERYG